MDLGSARCAQFIALAVHALAHCGLSMAFTTDPTYGLFNCRSHYQRLRRLVHLLSYVFNSSTILLPNAPFRIYWDVILDPRSDLAAATDALAPSAAAAAAAALAPSAAAAAAAAAAALAPSAATATAARAPSAAAAAALAPSAAAATAALAPSARAAAPAWCALWPTRRYAMHIRGLSIAGDDRDVCALQHARHPHRRRTTPPLEPCRGGPIRLPVAFDPLRLACSLTCVRACVRACAWIPCGAVRRTARPALSAGPSGVSVQVWDLGSDDLQPAGSYVTYLNNLIDTCFALDIIAHLRTA